MDVGTGAVPRVLGVLFTVIAGVAGVLALGGGSVVGAVVLFGVAAVIYASVGREGQG